MNTPKTLSVEAALKEYQEDAARCCDSCQKTAQRDECKVAFQHGWNKANSQERRRTEELEKEVEKIKQDMHLAVSNAGKDLIKERDAAIERAEKAEKETLLAKRLLSRVRPNHSSGCFGRTLKGEPTTAEFCEEVKCKVWQRRQLLSEGVSIDAEDPEVVALKKEVSGVQKRVSKLQQERDQTLALAKDYREALEPTLKLYGYGLNHNTAAEYPPKIHRQAHEVMNRVRNVLDAFPTSLLERFKAEQEVIAAAKKLMTVTSVAGQPEKEMKAALDALEQLK